MTEQNETYMQSNINKHDINQHKIDDWTGFAFIPLMTRACKGDA